jgi:hypothetical protein
MEEEYKKKIEFELLEKKADLESQIQSKESEIH